MANDENEEIVAQVSSLINNLDINQQSQLMTQLVNSGARGAHTLNPTSMSFGQSHSRIMESKQNKNI
jgi:hypothetical protein